MQKSLGKKLSKYKICNAWPTLRKTKLRKLQLHKRKDLKIKKLKDKQKLQQLSIQFQLIFA